MRVDARLLRAGVFLVALGVVPLLVQAGVVDPSSFQGAGRLWPVVLVAIGIGLLLRATPLALLGGVFVAALLGLLAGATIATGGSFVGGCVGPATTGQPLQASVGAFEGVNASVHLALDCGELSVTTQAGNGWLVRTDAARRSAATIAADGGRLDVRSPSGSRSIFDFGVSEPRDRWEVVLPTGPQLGSVDVSLNAATGNVDLGGAHVGDLRVVVNAGSVMVDLSGATVTRVNATANAGKLGLRLGPGADLPVTVAVNAGQLDVCVAPGTALQIDLRESLGSNNFASRGLFRSGNQWTSPDFDGATTRVRMQLSPNAAAVALDPDGGCHA
jgi:hypothetical protein